MAGGRPTKYEQRFCEEVIEHMKDGASLTSFAAEIGVARSTINEWIDNQPEFSEAVKIGKARCAAWWEKLSRQNAAEGGGNATLCIFGLKNMAAEDWRDKQEIEHSGSIDVNKMTDDALDRRIAELINATTSTE